MHEVSALPHGLDGLPRGRERRGTSQDTYRRDVLELIERKAAGKDIKPPAEAEPEPADDLLAALEASVDGGRKRRRRAKASA